MSPTPSVNEAGLRMAVRPLKSDSLFLILIQKIVNYLRDGMAEFPFYVFKGIYSQNVKIITLRAVKFFKKLPSAS